MQTHELYDSNLELKYGNNDGTVMNNKTKHIDATNPRLLHPLETRGHVKLDMLSAVLA